jgi:DnaJ-domain-containing protein 1
VEVDIATSIAFKMVAECCAELRFVVLVDCHSFSVDRGGAMRRVAALVSAFVRKFQPPSSPQALAFTFLFTKTDALGEAASRELALERLRVVLKDTQSGTSDGDVKQVLQWMISCVHFKYPFVDVYHPGLSDVAQLRTAIESFEQKVPPGSNKPPRVFAIKVPREEVRCGLTPKAESQIKLDLKTHLEELRVAMNDGHVAAGATLLHTLAFLCKHIDKQYVRGAYATAVAQWGEYGTGVVLPQAYDSLDKGLLRGINGPAHFTLERGREALRSLATLRLFEQHEVPGMPAKPAEAALEHLRCGLSELSERMQAGLSLARAGPLDASSLPRNDQTFADSVAALKRLRVWVQVHPEFASAADAAEAAMRTHQAQLVELATSEAAAVPCLLVPALEHLFICSESDARLETAVAAGVARLDALVKTTVDEAAAALDSEGLTCYRASLTRLDELKALLGSGAAVRRASPLGDLYARVCQARAATLGRAKTQLQQMHDEIDAVVGACDEGGLVSHSGDATGLDASLRRLEGLLATMRPLVDTLTVEEHCECQTGELFAQAVTSVSAPVHRLLSRAQECCLRELRDLEPLSSPLAHVKRLTQLASCTWIDTHLHDTEAFVCTGMEKLHLQYVQFSGRAAHAALKALDKYLGNADDDAGDRVRESEAAAFAEATSVLLQLSSALGGELISGVGKQASEFSTGARAAVNKWARKDRRFAALSTNVGGIALLEVKGATDMDEALGVCQIVSGCALDIKLLVNLGAEIREGLAETSAALRHLFEAAPAQAEQRAAALAALHTLRANGLQRVTALLPDVDRCRESVIAEVRSKLTAAREAVNESAGDSDAAAATLLELSELAHAFGDFDFGQQAAQTAGDLSQTLELRGACLDETLHESLASGRFSYVREYIEPLMGTKDPIKREKLNRTLAAVKDVLLQRFDGANASVADTPRVAEAIGVLDDAAKHLGKVLLEQHGFDVPLHSNALKERVVACLQRHVDSLEAAIAAQRFADVMEGAGVTKDYLDAVAQLLAPAEAAPCPAQKRRQTRCGGSSAGAKRPEPPPVEDANEALKGRARAALCSAEACQKGVDKAVKAFVAHLQSQQLGRSEHVHSTTSLCQMLSKLKIAASVGGSQPATAAALVAAYEAATRELTHALSSKLEEVKTQVESEQLVAYGRAVFAYVAAELRRGLHDHVTLQVDVEAVTSRLKAAEGEAAEGMQAVLFTVEYIDTSIRPKLDHLQRSSNPFLAFWRKGEYRVAKESFCAQLNELIDATRTAVLQTHNFELAGQNIAVIRHIFTTLSVHLHQSEQSAWASVKRSIVGEFGSVCERVKGALAQGDALSFELAVRRLHAFEERLTGVEAAKVKSEAKGVHEAVHAWLVAEVKTLLELLQSASGLGAAAESVQRLRRVGRVLASTWALYVDLADASHRHSKTDAALASIAKLSAKHFGGEAQVTIGMAYALLELDESATQKDVVKAYKAMSKRHHPDKRTALPDEAVGDEHVMQQRVGNAKETLEKDATRARFQAAVKAPFAAEIKKVPSIVLVRLHRLLEEHEYGSVHLELVQLGDLPDLLALVDGAEKKKPAKAAHEAVKAHMQKIRSNVDRLWEQKRYKELNTQLNAVDAADKVFGAYKAFYSPQWARDVRTMVEIYIESIAETARVCVHGRSEEEAELKLKDFALKLIMLGRILDELPRYKDFCRQKTAQALQLDP